MGKMLVECVFLMDGKQGEVMQRKYLTWPAMGCSSRGPLF